MSHYFSVFDMLWNLGLFWFPNFSQLKLWTFFLDDPSPPSIWTKSQVSLLFLLESFPSSSWTIVDQGKGSIKQIIFMAVSMNSEGSTCIGQNRDKISPPSIGSEIWIKTIKHIESTFLTPDLYLYPICSQVKFLPKCSNSQEEHFM